MIADDDWYTAINGFMSIMSEMFMSLLNFIKVEDCITQYRTTSDVPANDNDVVDVCARRLTSVLPLRDSLCRAIGYFLTPVSDRVEAE